MLGCLSLSTYHWTSHGSNSNSCLHLKKKLQSLQQCYPSHHTQVVVQYQTLGITVEIYCNNCGFKYNLCQAWIYFSHIPPHWFSVMYYWTVSNIWLNTHTSKMQQSDFQRKLMDVTNHRSAVTTVSGFIPCHWGFKQCIPTVAVFHLYTYPF